LECNCDYCKRQLAIERAGGPEKLYQQTAKRLTNQRLRNALDRFWKTAEQNTQERLRREKNYNDTLRLLSLFEKPK
jgi:outer membrane protein assembly factor BamD (BamD/ComL family)